MKSLLRLFAMALASLKAAEPRALISALMAAAFSISFATGDRDFRRVRLAVGRRFAAVFLRPVFLRDTLRRFFTDLRRGALRLAAFFRRTLRLVLATLRRFLRAAI
jgi:hypothetical protein